MRISNEYMTETCKIGQGKKCCRYLTVGVNGFECEKLGTLKTIIDLRVSQMRAQSDNCDGLDNKNEDK